MTLPSPSQQSQLNPLPLSSQPPSPVPAKGKRATRGSDRAKGSAPSLIIVTLNTNINSCVTAVDQTLSLASRDSPTVVILRATGPAISKAITISEVVKRKRDGGDLTGHAARPATATRSGAGMEPDSMAGIESGPQIGHFEIKSRLFRVPYPDRITKSKNEMRTNVDQGRVAGSSHLSSANKDDANIDDKDKDNDNDDVDDLGEWKDDAQMTTSINPTDKFLPCLELTLSLAPIN